MTYVWWILGFILFIVVLFGVYRATQSPIFWSKVISTVLSNFNIKIFSSLKDNKPTKRKKRMQKWD